MRFAWLAPASLALWTACILPSARPIPYAPHPERVSEPMDVLRRAAQPTCARGVRVEQVGRKIVYTSSCWTTWRGDPSPQEADLEGLTSVRIVFGDWYQVVLVHGSAETDLPHSASSEAEAILLADALLALRDRR